MAPYSDREIILSQIKKALDNKTECRYPAVESPDIFIKNSREDLTLQFQTEFTSLLGKFFLCPSVEEMRSKLKELFSMENWHSIFCNNFALRQILDLETLPFINAEGINGSGAALTDCECLIARTGTIVLSTAQPSGRILPIYTPVHIVIAYSYQIVPDIKDSIGLLKDKYTHHLPSMISLATGPSRTGDIEKTLVVGVHGPREVYVLLIDDPGKP